MYKVKQRNTFMSQSTFLFKAFPYRFPKVLHSRVCQSADHSHYLHTERERFVFSHYITCYIFSVCSFKYTLSAAFTVYKLCTYTFNSPWCDLTHKRIPNLFPRPFINTNVKSQSLAPFVWVFVGPGWFFQWLCYCMLSRVWIWSALGVLYQFGSDPFHPSGSGGPNWENHTKQAFMIHSHDIVTVRRTNYKSLEFTKLFTLFSFSPLLMNL